jgi:Arc/MetJ-type ribon-helix-helix transcriptional regulator
MGNGGRMTTKQLNVRLPEVVIDDINELSEIYGSQAKAMIAAITNLKKEIEMKKKAQQALDAIDNAETAETEEARLEAADRAIAAMQSLPADQQEEIAKQEFIRFKKFIGNRVAKGKGGA